MMFLNHTSAGFYNGLTIAASKRICSEMLLLLGKSCPVSSVMNLVQIRAFNRYVTDALCGIKDKKVPDAN